MSGMSVFSRHQLALQAVADAVNDDDDDALHDSDADTEKKCAVATASCFGMDTGVVKQR
jgi:hypothetical protein